MTTEEIVAIISCIISFIGLFISGAGAIYYAKKVKVKIKNIDEMCIINNELNTQIGQLNSKITEIELNVGNLQVNLDNSQKQIANIVNVTNNNGLTKQDSEAVSVLVKSYVDRLEQQNNNLVQIALKATEYLKDSKMQLSSYTKIDWINVYLESAKNTSDVFMQDIWAKVLAREIANPGSFSYKTIDVLKNMSTDDFKLFEKIINFKLSNVIIKELVMDNKYINWLDLQTLSSLGLINLNDSMRTFDIKANGKLYFRFNNLCYIIENNTNMKQTFSVDCYVFYTAAIQISNIIIPEYSSEFIQFFSKIIKEKFSKFKSSEVIIELKEIEKETEEGIFFKKENLLDK